MVKHQFKRYPSFEDHEDAQTQYLQTNRASVAKQDTVPLAAFHGSTPTLFHKTKQDPMPLEQLANIHKILVSRGIYVCVTPNGLSGPHDTSKYFDLVATGFHLKEYTNAELSCLFKQAGFSKVRAYIGAPGVYMRFPLVLLRLQEGLLSRLPRRLGRAIARMSLSWCIRLVGIKE